MRSHSPLAKKIPFSVNLKPRRTYIYLHRNLLYKNMFWYKCFDAFFCVTTLVSLLFSQFTQGFGGQGSVRLLSQISTVYPLLKLRHFLQLLSKFTVPNPEQTFSVNTHIHMICLFVYKYYYIQYSMCTCYFVCQVKKIQWTATYGQHNFLKIFII